jgi:hypothetical protein
MMRRVLKRRATRDFSKTSQFFIVLVQANGLGLSLAEHARYLEIWYLLQLALTAGQLAIIFYFWNTVPPLLRTQQVGNTASNST